MLAEDNSSKRYRKGETTIHLGNSPVCTRFDMKPLNGLIFETYKNGQLRRRN